MFDTSGVDDLDAMAASDALAAVRRKLLAVEAEQLALAAHWADLHAPEFVEECEELLPGDGPGSERSKPLGGDGCPEMSEFAGAELAALLGRSTESGEALIVDAVTLRHRHPGLWRGIQEGRVRVWLAIRAGRMCTSAQLTQEQAHWVDGETTPYVETLPPGRYLNLVAAKIIAADPAAAAERATAAELARFVRAGQTDENGLRTLVARARAGDVTVLVAVIDRIAAILSDRGDTDPVDVRRATALRVLANPAEALELLASAALQHLDASPSADDAEPSVAEATARTDDVRASDRWAAGEGERSDGRFVGRPEEWVGWMCDSSGRHLPANCMRRDLENLDLDVPRADRATGAVAPDDPLVEHDSPTPQPAGPPEPPGEPDASHTLCLLGSGTHPVNLLGADPPDPPGADVGMGLADRDLLRAVADSAARAAFRLAPTCVLHVHASSETLGSGDGVVRVEEIGPLVLAQVRSWLTGEQSGEHLGVTGGVGGVRIQVRPVLDPDRVAPVDRYEVPVTMRRAVEELHPLRLLSLRHRAVAQLRPGPRRPLPARWSGRPDQGREPPAAGSPPSSDQDLRCLAGGGGGARRLLVAHSHRSLVPRRPGGDPPGRTQHRPRPSARRRLGLAHARSHAHARRHGVREVGARGRLSSRAQARKPPRHHVDVARAPTR